MAAQAAAQAAATLAAQEEERKQEEERQRTLEKERPKAEAIWMGPVMSYRIALAEDLRDEAKNGIAKEKRYARYGGVVDRAVLYDLQQQIREADDEIYRLREMAKAQKGRLTGRSSRLFGRAQDCIVETDLVGQDCYWIRAFYQATAPN